MTVAQKVPFELVALDGPASGFTDAFDVGGGSGRGDRGDSRPRPLAAAPLRRLGIGLPRAPGRRMQMVGERLGIADQFQGVDELTVGADGSLEILERIEGGQHQVSVCAGPPAVLGWATGNLPEPPNNPQVGHGEHAPRSCRRCRGRSRRSCRRRPVRSRAWRCRSSGARRRDREGPARRRDRARDRGVDNRSERDRDGNNSLPRTSRSRRLAGEARARGADRRAHARGGAARRDRSSPGWSGRRPQAAAAGLGRLRRARAFLGVSGDEFAQSRYATDAAAAEALCRAAGADARPRAGDVALGAGRCRASPSASADASTRTSPASAPTDGAVSVSALVLPPAHGSRRCSARSGRGSFSSIPAC